MSGQQKTNFYFIDLRPDPSSKLSFVGIPPSKVQLQLWQLFKQISTHLPASSSSEIKLKDIAALFDYLVLLSEAAQAQLPTSVPESTKEDPHA